MNRSMDQSDESFPPSLLTRSSQLTGSLTTIGKSPSRLELATFKFPQTELLPPTPIRTWSCASIHPEIVKECKEQPAWLYPEIDWEKENRWGHFYLKLFALLARLMAAVYWLVTDIPSVTEWKVRVLFYHVCPGLLGVETSAIIPYVLTPVPYRILSWVHDILGIGLGISAVVSLYIYNREQTALITFLSVTVIPLTADLVLHILTLPKHDLTV